MIKAITSAKESRVSGYDLNESDLGNYEENMLFRLAVHNKVKELYSEMFEQIQEKYLPQVKRIRDAVLSV